MASRPTSAMQAKAQAALKLREVRQRQELEARYDWYGSSCPCGLPAGKCRRHQRARDKQRPGGTPGSPLPDRWRVLFLMAGRGAGKTRPGSEYVRWKVEKGHWREIILVNATIGDTRDKMVEGPSGLLAVSPPWFRPTYYPSKARVEWPNGAKAYLRTSEEPDGLRGDNIDGVWGDEPGKWVKQRETWEQIGWVMRNRTEPPPQCVLTGTPEWYAEFMFEIAEAAEAEKERAGSTKTFIVSWHTAENQDHLDPDWFAAQMAKYEGTLIGQQELGGILIRRRPGALWGPEEFERPNFRIPPISPAEANRVFEYIGVALDPASGSDDQGRASEAGIVVGGRRVRAPGQLARGVVLEDRSCSGQPSDWGKAVVRAFFDWSANEIVYETNQGGAMVAEIIRSTPAADGYPSGRDIPLHGVYASRGKVARAEPIQTIYQAGRVQHVQGLPDLESQMIRFKPGVANQKLDRVDADVWILTRAVLEQDAAQETGQIIVGLDRPGFGWIGDLRTM